MFVPVAKGAFKIEVASGMVYPEHVLHGKPVPHVFVRVTADMVHANTVDCKLDFPTTDTEIDTLGQAKNEFILWARRDITLEGYVPAQIQRTLEPVAEQHDPLYPESQVALPPPSPVTEPTHAPNAPEQELTTASAPSIGSPPPTRPIIEDTSERSVAVQAWDAATKGKKFQKPMTTQKKKSKGTIYKSKRDELNEFIEAPSSYEWGKPILSKAALAEKSMSIKRLHAWYL